MTRALMVECVCGRWQISNWQLCQKWDWILREGEEAEPRGVIVPADPKAPMRYPEHTLLASEYADG